MYYALFTFDDGDGIYRYEMQSQDLASVKAEFDTALSYGIVPLLVAGKDEWSCGDTFTFNED